RRRDRHRGPDLGDHEKCRRVRCCPDPHPGRRRGEEGRRILMKIIHIAGFSNTGKTTFIRELVPELEKRGLTGVVKHIGHHGHSLPEGKDTTFFHEAGAAASAGIDAQKSVLILKETDLERILAMFCDAGVQYAVIEGFKEKPYPKVVIGNVANATNVLLTNPSVEEVLSHLGEFSDM